MKEVYYNLQGINGEKEALEIETIMILVNGVWIDYDPRQLYEATSMVIDFKGGHVVLDVSKLLDFVLVGCE